MLGIEVSHCVKNYVKTSFFFKSIIENEINSNLREIERIRCTAG